jgi:hypothetical protein
MRKGIGYEGLGGSGLGSGSLLRRFEDSRKLREGMQAQDG